MDDDHVLLDRLRAGDERAFEMLVNRYDGGLRRVARTFVRTPSAVDAVVQETWLGVLRGLDAFEGRSSLQTWMFSILVTRRARARSAMHAACRSPVPGSASPWPRSCGWVSDAPLATPPRTGPARLPRVRRARHRLRRGTLTEHDRVRMDAHLAECDGCAGYLQDMRTLVGSLHDTPEPPADEATRDALLRAFRELRGAP